jgi:hypothetical protein
MSFNMQINVFTYDNSEVLAICSQTARKMRAVLTLGDTLRNSVRLSNILKYRIII